MTVATVLVLYAACVGTLGSRMLGRAAWPGRAPLLAIVTYLAAAWSVAAALGLAGLTLAIHATALAGGLSSLIGACVLRLRDVYATPGGATVAGLGLTLTGAVVARTAIVATTHLRAIRRHALQHAEAARLIGQPRANPGGRPGRPRAASRLLRRGPAADCDRDHWHAASAGPRPARCRAGARTSAPGLPPPPAVGHRQDRIPGASVHSADAGRGHPDSAADRDARRRRGDRHARRRGAGHRAGRAGQHRPSRRLGSLRPPPTRCSGYGGCSARPNH